MRFFILLFLLCFGVVSAQEIQQITSPRGQAAWLVEDNTAPTVSIYFTFAGIGAVTDPDGKGGSTSFMAGMLTQGAGQWDSQTFKKRLNDLSVTLDFSAGKDNVHGEFMALKKYLPEAKELLRLAMTSPRFDRKDFDRIKKIMASNAAQAEKDPASRVNRLLWEFTFAGDRYALPTDGTESSINNITLTDIKKQHKNLSRQELHIGVAGNISAKELSQLLDDVFGNLPTTPPTLRQLPQAQFTNQGKTTLTEQQIPQTHIAFIQTGLPFDDPDYFAAFVLNHIIGGSVFSSVLGQEIREKRGLAYSVYSTHHNLRRAPVIIGGAATNNQDAARTVQLIRQIWRDAAGGNLTQTQLDSARLYLLGSYGIGLTNTSAIAGWLAYLQRRGESPDYIAHRTEQISAITLPDLQRVAKRLLDENSLTFAIVGNPDGISAR